MCVAHIPHTPYGALAHLGGASMPVHTTGAGLAQHWRTDALVQRHGPLVEGTRSMDSALNFSGRKRKK